MRAILSKLSSISGQIFSFFARSQTDTRSVTFLQLHTCFHPLLPSRTDSASVKRRGGSCLWVIFLHASSTPGQFSFFSVYSKPTKGFVTYFQKNAKLRTCFSPMMSPGAHSVAVKRLNARSFRLLSHILEFLVDVGPLSHFCLRERQKLRSLQTKRYTAQPLLQPVAVFRDRFQSSEIPLGKIIVCGPYC